MSDKMNVIITSGVTKVSIETQSIIDMVKNSDTTVSQKAIIGIANNIISNYLSQLFNPLFINFNVNGYDIVSKMLDNIKIGNFIPFKDYKGIIRELIKMEIKTLSHIYGIKYDKMEESQKQNIDKIITDICNDLSRL